MISDFDLEYWKTNIIEISKYLDEQFASFGEKSRISISVETIKRLRDLMDHIGAFIYLSEDPNYKPKNEFDCIEKGKKYIRSNGTKYCLLDQFSKKLKISVSHYSPFDEGAERLMIGYIEYLVQLKHFLYRDYRIEILKNVQKFPLDLDKTFEEYYRKIVETMRPIEFDDKTAKNSDYYYAIKKKTIYCEGQLFYEYTLTNVMNSSNKFSSITAFSRINIFKEYAIKASIAEYPVQLFGKDVPLFFITGYEVSIRPCELETFTRIINCKKHFSFERNVGYSNLMNLIKKTRKTIDQLIDIPDSQFGTFVEKIANRETALKTFLSESRRIIRRNQRGSNVVRYLLHTMNKEILDSQKPYYEQSENSAFGELNITEKDLLFDLMPFAFSLVKHNPTFETLVDCFDLSEHEHELIKRWVADANRKNSKLYLSFNPKDKTSIESEVKNFNDFCDRNRIAPNLNLGIFRNFIFDLAKEKETRFILERLLAYSQKINFEHYEDYANSKIAEQPAKIDDPLKIGALKAMFATGSLFAVYGSAGTGKTTYAKYALDLLGENTKAICITNTNTALSNLKDKLKSPNVEFFTAYKIKQSNRELKCTILIIDECSTISNLDMSNILEKVDAQLILLLGDIYQIESIQFGNWFSVLQKFLPKTAYVELTTGFRAKTNDNLLSLWEAVRENKPEAQELLSKFKVSKRMGESIFTRSNKGDEVILCLNYDGLYGINSINTYLQASNPNKPVHWKHYTFKKGDPILFIETKRFHPVLYNNLKGTIVNVEIDKDDNIHFVLDVEKTLNPTTDKVGNIYDITPLGNGVTRVSFMVRRASINDIDKGSAKDCVIPFQIAYALSIHKAQGLEYDSVKIVIANDVEAKITQNIFYTAITRSKHDLTIYWTPESENKIMKDLMNKDSANDAHILSIRFQSLVRNRQ